MGASKKISLFAPIFLSATTLVAQEKAPLPLKLMEARTVFLLNQTGHNAVLDGAYQALKKWGRWKVLTDKDAADLILQIDGTGGTKMIPYTLPKYETITQPGQWPKTKITTEEHSLPWPDNNFFLHVLASDSGEPLWTTQASALSLENCGKDLIENLQKRMRDLKAPTPGPAGKPTKDESTELIWRLWEGCAWSAGCTEKAEAGTRLYIEGYDQAFGDNRRVADCLITKLNERGAFTFETSKADAGGILILDVTIPGASSRLLWSKTPSVHLTVIAPDGRLLWKGENKYKKATTIWGSATDVPCGLANGIADKFVKAMQGGEMVLEDVSATQPVEAKQPALPTDTPKPANDIPPAPTVQQQVEPSAITFKSSPEGADITVDGKFIGSTPSTVQLTPGDHEVTIQKIESDVGRNADGEVTVPIYKIWKRTLTVNPGGAITLDATLEKVQ